MTAPALPAVLFDMDGLLVDSEPLWTVAEQDLAERLGGVFTDELKARIVGTRLEVAVPTMLRWYGADGGPAQVAETSAWLLDRMVALFAGPLTFLPGSLALLAALEREGVPTALVSSSYRVLVDAVLARVPTPFATTLSGDEVVHGKPHPEPYLTAAARLGVDPAGCVVLEDSPAGIAAGEAAGCAVVVVPSVPGVAVAPAARRLVVASLETVGVPALRALAAG